MKYPLFKAHLPEVEIIQNLREVFRSGYINEGVQVTDLTNKLGIKLATKHIVLLNSCTSALTLSLYLAGVSQGDEVISTPMTCVASNTPIIANGAKIVWTDIDPNTGMPTPEQITEKITPKTKAVMIVAWAGTPPDLKAIKNVCDSAGIKLILDAAHAFGAMFEGKPIHQFANYTCYSFQAIKHFTTGDGGAIICSDTQDYKRAKALKWFGLDRDKAKDEKGDWKGQQWDVNIVEAGFKYNMNNVSAAIGLAQLNHIDRILSIHRKNAAYYDRMFESLKLLRPITKLTQAQSSNWVYTVRLDKSVAKHRDEILQKLNEEGIMAGLVHVPNDNYTCFIENKKNKIILPGVREFSECQFSLPCGWWMINDHVHHVATRVKQICAEFGIK